MRIRKLADGIEAGLEKILEERLASAMDETYQSVHRMIQPLEHMFQSTHPSLFYPCVTFGSTR